MAKKTGKNRCSLLKDAKRKARDMREDFGFLLNHGLAAQNVMDLHWHLLRAINEDDETDRRSAIRSVLVDLAAHCQRWDDDLLSQ